MLITGCIVNRRITFEDEPNAPPSIRSAPSAREFGTALGQIVYLDLAQSGQPGSGLEFSEALVFPLIVSDRNLQQRLVWRRFIDFDPQLVSGPDAGRVIEPSGAEDRFFDVVVPYDIFRDGAGECHKLEVLVSGGFVDEFPFREPVLEGDLASAFWWIHVTDDTRLTVDMRTCP